MVMRTFQPTPHFDMDVNRAERGWQVRYLAPLLARADGLEWFLRQIKLPVPAAEASVEQVYQLCFPLRDLLARELEECRGIPACEAELIAYYENLFDRGIARYQERFHLPKVLLPRHRWRRSAAGHICHPGAPGGGGESVPGDLVPLLFRTESDVLILTRTHVVIVECKLETGLDAEQHERQQMVGHILAERFDREFHFGLVAREARVRPRLDVPFVRWEAIQHELARLSAGG